MSFFNYKLQIVAYLLHIFSANKQNFTLVAENELVLATSSAIIKYNFAFQHHLALGHYRGHPANRVRSADHLLSPSSLDLADFRWGTHGRQGSRNSHKPTRQSNRKTARYKCFVVKNSKRQNIVSPFTKRKI